MTARGRAFGGVTLVAVYALRRETDELRLVETSGGSLSRYGLRFAYPVSARSPAADACRTGRPLWLDAAGLAAYSGAPPAGISLAALPLGGNGDSGPLGCLVAVDESGEGFGTDRRGLLELYARHVGEGLEAGGEPGQGSVLGHAVEEGWFGSFAMEPRGGRVEADAQTLELMDLPRRSSTAGSTPSWPTSFPRTGHR